MELTVTDADTAQSLGSGDVPVLGTPRVLALAEAATVAATARQMPGGVTTVGTRAEVEHQLPTPVGGRSTALATLTKVDGRKLIFEVVVQDGDALVAEVRVERVMLDRQRFIAKALGDQSRAPQRSTSSSLVGIAVAPPRRSQTRPATASAKRTLRCQPASSAGQAVGQQATDQRAHHRVTGAGRVDRGHARRGQHRRAVRRPPRRRPSTRR